MKTIDYIETIKKKNNISYYRMAKMLCISESTISHYRKQNRFFDDETAIKVAELLEINPQIVLADIHAERSKIRKTKEVWQGIAKALRTTTVAVFVVAIIASHKNNSELNQYVTHVTAEEYLLC